MIRARSFISQYEAMVIGAPRTVLSIVILVTVFSAYHGLSFRLDASSDSLVLQSDQALAVYRSVRERYGSDDYLIIAYTPNSPLFSDDTLHAISALQSELEALERVESVTSILDAPLLSGVEVKLSQSTVFATLADRSTDRQRAARELAASDFYRNLLVGSDGRTTAIQIAFKQDESHLERQKERTKLRELARAGELTQAQKQRLMLLDAMIRSDNVRLLEQQDKDTRHVRDIMQRYRDSGELFLGGVPMIVADSITYVRHDLIVFGSSVLAFVVVLLGVTFRRPRWVVLPLTVCLCSAITMLGFLGWAGWPVTVVSSNFVALLLIISLSLTIHLAVRYRELIFDTQVPPEPRVAVMQMVSSKFKPCLYTAATTIIAFGSLIVSDVKPVIDFGWMMSVGVVIAFIYSFTLLPAALVLMPTERIRSTGHTTAKLTEGIASYIEKNPRTVLTAFSVVVLSGALGMSLLDVQNRFIDYYKSSTEIYRGMTLIDRQLGGTTPFDVIIRAPANSAEIEHDEWEDFADNTNAEDLPLTATSYWFNSFKLRKIKKIHEYLDSLPDTGKVLSLHSAVSLLGELEGPDMTDDFYLALLLNKLPVIIKQTLIDPYLSNDGDEIRFALRVYESDASLDRDVLLNEIRNYLMTQHEISPEQVHLTGMMVLYNNVLNSLFRSQILTLGFVFLCVFAMFYLVFRNFPLSVIAIVPNVVAAVAVLGVMGWLSIPLDIMTITVAAICVGIAVDDTIHFVHRFMEEFERDGGYWASVHRSHASIGLAMTYTTITITLGFSILVLSNFVPTIHFGLLTGFSMLIALAADLMLLPLLIVLFKPLGQKSTRPLQTST